MTFRLSQRSGSVPLLPVHAFLLQFRSGLNCRICRSPAANRAGKINRISKTLRQAPRSTILRQESSGKMTAFVDPHDPRHAPATRILLEGFALFSLFSDGLTSCSFR